MPLKTKSGNVYSDYQLAVAQQTYLFVKAFGFYDRPALAGITTQVVESSLWGPIRWGDQENTKGAFQQKDDWINPAVLFTDQDPRYSLIGGLSMFLFGGYARQKGLFAFNWVTEDIGTLCQKVQQSGVPDAYKKALPDATEILAYVKTMLSTAPAEMIVRPVRRLSRTTTEWGF